MTEEAAKPEKLLQRAKELYQKGDLEASANCFQRLLAAKETRSEAYYGLGLIKFSQKNYAEALDFFMTATQVNPHNANAQYYIGVIHEEQRNLEEARNDYLKALSINPDHRGATEGVARLGNTTPNSTFSSVNAKVYPKSEFIERLSNDKSLAAQRALALIGELEFAAKPPLASHLGGILLGVMKAVGTVIVFSFFLFLLLTGVIILDDPFSGRAPPVIAGIYLAPIMALLMVVGIIVSITLGVKSANNTKYVFGKGVIQITKGALTIRTETIEMYRVTGINVVQDWASRRIGCATLVLTADTSRQVALPGVGEASRVYYLQDRLRELVVLLRSLSWIKGIIS